MRRPWFCAYLSSTEWGDTISVSYYHTDENGKHIKQWDHDIQVSEKTEVPIEDEAIWASSMARTFSRYFEDRVIEQIRASVSKPNVSTEEPT